MSEAALHIVVGHSAGGCLRQAVRQARLKAQVIAIGDDFSIGPIDPPDPKLRAAWAERELGFTPDEGSWVAKASTFSDSALSASGPRVIWVMRRAAHEYAGFLELLWRLGDEAVEVVDLTDVEIEWGNGTREPLRSTGELHPDRIRENALWNRATPLAPAVRARYREMWRKLRAENAPFRVVADQDLVSAPISFFDELLMSCAGTEWQKTAHVLGDAISKYDGSVGDLVLLGRVRSLVAAGSLEARGDLSATRSSELRLPPQG
jgi:uncharacterized protein DUF3658/uncharacterized protein DUF1835